MKLHEAKNTSVYGSNASARACARHYRLRRQ